MAFTSYGARYCITSRPRLIYEQAEGFPEPTQQRNAPTPDVSAGRFMRLKAALLGSYMVATLISRPRDCPLRY